jgi:hypothetical protein
MEADEGWAADPFGAHELRYFVDGRPTKLVRDESVEGFDDLPPGSTWPSSLSPTEPTTPGPALEPTQPLTSEPSPPPATPSGASYWAPPPPPPPLPLGGVGFGGQPSHDDGDLAESSLAGLGESPTLGVGLSDTFVGGSDPVRSPRPKRRLVTGVVVVLVAAAAGGFVLAGGGAKSAEAAVIDSVNSTMADRTAHVTMNLAVNTSSTTVSGTGTGDIDFGRNAMQLQLTVGLAGQQVQMQAVYVAGSVYEQVPGLGQLIPGKSWISLDLSSLAAASGQSAGALGTSNNPTAMLRLLAQQGNTVVSLGSSTIGDTPVQGYSVTLDPAAIRAKLAHADLPSWMTTALSQLNIQGTTLKVYVDGSGLLRRFSLNLTETVASTAKVTVDESLDFSDYGATVNVTAPPPEQVVSFDQFLRDAGAAGGTPST